MKRLIPSLIALLLIIGLSSGQLNTDRSGKEQIKASILNALKSGESSDACHVYGKIKFVDNFADYQVKVVEHHEDLKVEYVDNFADEPGKWEVVDHHEDHKIEIVEHHEDFTIKEVDNFPGCD